MRAQTTKGQRPCTSKSRHSGFCVSTVVAPPKVQGVTLVNAGLPLTLVICLLVI